MKKYFDKTKVPSILLAKVAKSDTRKYGIAKLKNLKNFMILKRLKKLWKNQILSMHRQNFALLEGIFLIMT